MRPTNNTRKRAAAVAGLTVLCSCNKHNSYIISSAFTPTSSSIPLAFTNGRGNVGGVNRRPSLFARKKQQDKLNNTNTKSSSSSAKKSKTSSIIEEVKPLSSVSQEKRLRAIEALAAQQQQQQQQGKKNNSIDSKDPLLLQNMDAAAMLLETFTKATNTEEETDDNINGILNGKSSDNINGNSTPKKKKKVIKKSNSGSVPGATSMTTIRQQAADEGGYSLSPRDTKDLYREDGSNKNRWAVDSLIEKLDERIRESGNDVDTTSMDIAGIDNMEKVVEAPKKRGRGRPRKNPLPVDETQENTNGEVVKVQPIKAVKKKKKQVVKTSSKATTTTPNPAYRNIAEDDDDNTIQAQPKIKSKAGRPRAAVKGTETLIGASAIVNNKRRRRAASVKSLPGRRDENGNIIPPDGDKNKKIKGDGRIDSNRRQLSNDSLNLNRYYRTELLSAKEEYTLGMKVKFMVKCEAVHEGLTLQLDRLPTIAEWASACGFDTYDAEMCSESYVDNELDKQIRPSGSEVNELDPNMFVGNGLVNDTGVGRGKGRAKKPPPTQIVDFYDDSYEKFKRKETDPTDLYDDKEDEEDGTDIFIYRQKMSPGGPINRGSPRIFREMMLTAKEAKQRMVECNMRLVVSIARRYHGVGVNVQDLVQEGSLGLARAAEKFDPKKGFKFSTYASWWIQQAVFRSIAYHSRTIRLPVHVHNLLNKVRRSRQIMQQELGRMPTNEEMAEEMDMSIEKYNKMIRNTRNALSLERPKYMNNPKDLGHESDVLVGDMVDSSSVIFDEKTPEQMVDNGLLHSDIQYMLGKVGDDERKVLCLRYGLNDGITRTVTLVASEMRQTKSWVRSQECRALRKLRRPWYEKRLNEHRLSLSASGVPL